MTEQHEEHKDAGNQPAKKEATWEAWDREDLTPEERETLKALDAWAEAAPPDIEPSEELRA